MVTVDEKFCLIITKKKNARLLNNCVITERAKLTYNKVVKSLGHRIYVLSV